MRSTFDHLLQIRWIEFVVYDVVIDFIFAVVNTTIVAALSTPVAITLSLRALVVWVLHPIRVLVGLCTTKVFRIMTDEMRP